MEMKGESVIAAFQMLGVISVAYLHHPAMFRHS
jgi:hypothetical protein